MNCSARRRAIVYPGLLVISCCSSCSFNSFLPPSQHFLCSASLCRRDLMPATGGAGSSTAGLLVSASAAALTTISISISCCGGGGAAGRSGALSREEEEDRTAPGPTGGFLSVGGSERWSGGWWASPAAGSMFSSEQRRLEGEGLEDTWGAAEEEEQSQAARLDPASERGSDSVPLSAGGGLLTTPLVSARGLLAAFGLSAIFLCRFSLRARVRSSSFYTHHQVDREVSSA